MVWVEFPHQNFYYRLFSPRIGQTFMGGLKLDVFTIDNFDIVAKTLNRHIDELAMEINKRIGYAFDETNIATNGKTLTLSYDPSFHVEKENIIDAMVLIFGKFIWLERHTIENPIYSIRIPDIMLKMLVYFYGYDIEKYTQVLMTINTVKLEDRDKLLNLLILSLAEK